VKNWKLTVLFGIIMLNIFFSFTLKAEALKTEAPKAETIDAGVSFDETAINYKAGEETNFKIKTQEEETTPILTQQKNKVEEQSGAMYRSLISVIIIFALGGLGLWYLKRKALRPDGKQALMQIKMLTQFHLAPRKSLMVVRVAGESLLLGIAENQICLLKSLSLLDEDIPDTTPKNFGQTIAQVDAAPNSAQPPKNTVLKSTEFSESDEDFAFGSIKHLVENKLKGMKRW
jgi:flagellar protein FliO/FliZ